MKNLGLIILLVSLQSSAQTTFAPAEWESITDNYAYSIVSDPNIDEGSCRFIFYKDKNRSQVNIIQTSISDCEQRVSLDDSLETLNCSTNVCTSEMNADELKGLSGNFLNIADHRKITLTIIPNSKELVLNIYLRGKTGVNLGGAGNEKTFRFRLRPVR